MSGNITLVPIGPVPADLMSWLLDRLPQVLQRQVRTGEEIPVPEQGFNQQRGQYLGDALLAVLGGLPYPEAERLVGLIDADCYADRLNFIFGQATLRGRPAVVALPRLRPSFYNRPDDPDLFHERVLKEVVHELGHTWGLDHCPDPSCVMHFSNSLQDTDLKSAKFCPQCQSQLS